MGTSACITLIAAGAILRFALAPGSPHGLNVHIVGIVLILAGALGLLVSLLVWGPLNRRRNRPAGYDLAASPLARQQRAYPGRPPAAGRRRAACLRGPAASLNPAARHQRDNSRSGASR
jgi:hypothetical protein